MPAADIGVVYLSSGIVHLSRIFIHNRGGKPLRLIQAMEKFVYFLPGVWVIVKMQSECISVGFGHLSDKLLSNKMRGCFTPS